MHCVKKNQDFNREGGGGGGENTSKVLHDYINFLFCLLYELYSFASAVCKHASMQLLPSNAIKGVLTHNKFHTT